MKIRNGFVSNSSSSSFTIYGWTEEVFKKALGEVSPLLEGMEVHLDDWKIIENLDKLWDDPYSMTSSYNRDRILVFGLGKSDGEFDHYIDNWKAYEIKEPPTEDMKKFQELAKKLNLPEPKLYKDTFFDG